MNEQTPGSSPHASPVPGSTTGGPAAGPPAGGAMPPPVSRKRPGGLTFLLVMALILGFLGAIIALKNSVPMLKGYDAALAEAVSGLEFGAKLNPMMNDEAFEAQKQMTEAALEASWSYRGITLVVAFVNLILCLGLIVGAIWLFGYKEKGRNLLVWTNLAHLPYQLLATGVTWAVTGAALEASRPFMGKLMAAQGGAAQAGLGDFAADFGAMVAKGFAVIGMVLLLAYYIWALTYLRKDKIRSICK